MKPDSNLKWTVAITIAVGYALPVHVEDSSCANGLLRSLAPYSQEPTRCGGTVASTTTAPGICNQAFEREIGVFSRLLRFPVPDEKYPYPRLQSAASMPPSSWTTSPRTFSVPVSEKALRIGLERVLSMFTLASRARQPARRSSIHPACRPSTPETVLEPPIAGSWGQTWHASMAVGRVYRELDGALAGCVLHCNFWSFGCRLWGAIAAGHPSASVGRQGFWFE